MLSAVWPVNCCEGQLIPVYDKMQGLSIEGVVEMFGNIKGTGKSTTI